MFLRRNKISENEQTIFNFQKKVSYKLFILEKHLRNNHMCNFDLRESTNNVTSCNI